MGQPGVVREIAIKVHTGKWRLHLPYPVLMDTVLNVYKFQVLPILPGHTARLIGLPDHHRDPFDRLLIAQAQLDDLVILTSDRVFGEYDVPVRWSTEG